MDFTREPIIETIITPKEGYKLVIRSSTSAGQEEYFVDAIEVVAFGHALFFRSLERPKAFLVPVSDYEVLEVREARMVLKNAGLDRSIKIGGGREAALKTSREPEKEEAFTIEEPSEQEEVTQELEASIVPETRPEVRVDKKRDRRRHYRKRKGRDEREEEVKEGILKPVLPALEEEKISLTPPELSTGDNQEESTSLSSTLLSSLLQPPPTLISETISRYRQNELFKGAFYLSEEDQYKPHDKVQELLNEEDEELVIPSLREPTFEAEEQSNEKESEAERSEGALENIPEENQLEDLVKEIQQQEESYFFSFDHEEDNQPEAALPLYAEEETTTGTTESSYPSEEEKNIVKDKPHSPLHE